MRRSILFVVMAMGVSLIAAVGVYRALREREEEVARARVEVVGVVVAARRLEVGERISGGMVRVARWSKESVPKGSYGGVKAVEGQVVARELEEGEPVLAGQLVGGEGGGGVLPLLIPAGMRAMAVAVDEVSDIAGFVLPGARVDVLLALSGPGGGMRSRTVLQDVLVLAVAQEVERRGGRPKTARVVTLLVRPEQAERLALAARSGTLRLALRSYGDRGRVASRGVGLEALWGDGGGRAGTGKPALSAVRGAARPARRVREPARVQVVRDGRSVEWVGFDGRGYAAPALGAVEGVYGMHDGGAAGALASDGRSRQAASASGSAASAAAGVRAGGALPAEAAAGLPAPALGSVEGAAGAGG